MEKFYCKLCGASFGSVRTLVSQYCSCHPAGYCKGHHELYEGSEKSEYTCKYCGVRARSIRILVTQYCSRHPNGACKGKHSVAL